MPLCTGGHARARTGRRLSQRQRPANDAAAMFDSATAPENRFLRFLKKLLPYLRRTLNKRLVVERIAEALKLETRLPRRSCGS